MQALGDRFGRAIIQGGGTFFLYGELGAGKTTFVRGLLRQLGHEGAVRSPTFTLIESYTLGRHRIHHLDLYRLSGRDALEDLGVRDLVDGEALCFIEWPERGAEGWVRPDIVLRIGVSGGTREVLVEAQTPWGRAILGRVTTRMPREPI